MRSLHRAYEAAPHAYRRAGEGSTLFWHGTCAAHEKASPSLHMARTLDVGRSTSCRRKCQHTGVPVLEEDRVLGGGRAPGVRVCPAPVYRGIAGGCPYPVAVIPPCLCLWRDAVCRVRTVFPGQGEQDTQRGAKGALPGTRLVFRRACLAVFAALA